MVPKNGSLQRFLHWLQHPHHRLASILDYGYFVAIRWQVKVPKFPPLITPRQGAFTLGVRRCGTGPQICDGPCVPDYHIETLSLVWLHLIIPCRTQSGVNVAMPQICPA
jgi:hypothetical protein